MRAVPDAELWVVGERLDSDRGEDMQALLRDAGLGERLRLLGYRDGRRRPDGGGGYLRAAEPVRGPADVGDRGDADRLPVVATDMRGPREQVVPEVTGLLVPPGDARRWPRRCARLAADAALRARMGAAGRQRAVERYDEAKVLARTLDLLGL